MQIISEHLPLIRSKDLMSPMLSNLHCRPGGVWDAILVIADGAFMDGCATHVVAESFTELRAPPRSRMSRAPGCFFPLGRRLDLCQGAQEGEGSVDQLTLTVLILVSVLLSRRLPPLILWWIRIYPMDLKNVLENEYVLDLKHVLEETLRNLTETNLGTLEIFDSLQQLLQQMINCWRPWDLWWARRRRTGLLKQDHQREWGGVVELHRNRHNGDMTVTISEHTASSWRR